MNPLLFPDLLVNGETVPSTQIAVEMRNHEGTGGGSGNPWRRAANALAIRTLLLQEARARGIAAEPDEVSPGRFETEEEALIRGLLDQAVTVAPPTEERVRDEWMKDPLRFRTPPLWQVSHILVACDPRDAATREAARVQAADLAARALGDPAGFARLAREASDCGSKTSGGALGQLRPGDTVPEFEAALRGMSEGDITADPVLTRHGWHIIRMDAVAPGLLLPFDAVRSKISDALEKAAWAAAARDFVQTLAASAEITGTDLRPV